MRKTLFDRLKEYSDSAMIPFHMPGHKRNPVLGCPWDITEIKGFDDLHYPQDVIKEIMICGTKLWGSDRCFLLVNGSTCGILSGIRSATKYGDKIIVARNCHKSVYHAIELCGLRPIYLYPPVDETTGIYGSVSPAVVEKALRENEDTSLVVLTSPTYEGVISDIREISASAHRHGTPVLIDEAHGAHLGFSEAFPNGAVKAGADIVVQSLHKTMASMTQTGLCHVSGSLVDGDKVMRELNVFETSSPSYLLMASIDRCFALLQEEGIAIFSQWEENLAVFSQSVKKLNHLSITCKGNDALKKHPSFFDYDASKILISLAQVKASGVTLADDLRNHFAIETEMAAKDYTLAMTGMGDVVRNFDQLSKALAALDNSYIPMQGKKTFWQPAPAKIGLSAARVGVKEVEFVDWDAALGHLSASYLWAYPPGIPWLVPGEVICGDFLDHVIAMQKEGVTLMLSHGKVGETIGVVKS